MSETGRKELVNVAQDDAEEDTLNDADEVEFVYSYARQDNIQGRGAQSDTFAMITLIKGNIGTGLLSLPVVLRRGGLLLGSIMVIGVGILASYLMRVMVNLAEELSHLPPDESGKKIERLSLDYNETVFQVFKNGPESLRIYKGKIKHTVNFFLILTQFGFCCVYILFMTENFVELITYYAPMLKTSGWFNKYVVGLGCALLLVPFSLLRNIKYFHYPSIIANILTLLATVFIVIFCFFGMKPVTSLPLIKDPLNVLISFGIIVYSFESIALVLPICNQMKTPRNYLTRFGILNTSMALVIITFFAVSFYGYLRFGADTPSTITLRMPKEGFFASVLPMFLVSVFVSYMMQFYVPAAIITVLMLKIRLHRNSSKSWKKVHTTIMRICLVFLTYGCALSVPSLDLMIGLVGSLSSTSLALIIPPILDLVFYYPRRFEPNTHYTLRVIFHGAIIVFGFLCFIFGTLATVVQIIQDYSKPS